MDKEKKFNDNFDKLNRKMQKDDPYFNQTFFYGH